MKLNEKLRYNKMIRNLIYKQASCTLNSEHKLKKKNLLEPEGGGGEEEEEKTWKLLKPF